MPGEAGARGVYLEPDRFLSEVFDGNVPDASVLWLTGRVQAGISRILGHPLPGLRLRYWRRGDRSAWILEEIGKEKPISTGLVVEAGAIALIRVLVYRESRGWEVRYPAFTGQFEGARLAGGLALDRRIDGITGATLSVRALTGLARVALLLHREVVAGGGAGTGR